jgi:hypothetical protein
VLQFWPLEAAQFKVLHATVVGFWNWFVWVHDNLSRNSQVVLRTNQFDLLFLSIYFVGTMTARAVGGEPGRREINGLACDAYDAFLNFEGACL